MLSEEYAHRGPKGASGMYIVEPLLKKPKTRQPKRQKFWAVLIIIILVIILAVGLGIGIHKALQHSEASGSAESKKVQEPCSLNNCDTSDIGKSDIGTSDIGASGIKEIKTTFVLEDALLSKVISPTTTINEIASSSAYVGPSPSKTISPSATINEITSSSADVDASSSKTTSSSTTINEITSSSTYVDASSSKTIPPSTTINEIRSSSAYVDASSSKTISPSSTINEITSSSAYVVKPASWSRWLAWSDCSTSCGGGLQTRTRVCSNPTGKNNQPTCSGKTSQTRNCSDWKCPDCSKVCPSGQLNDACDACVCTKNTFTGKVKNQGGVLLDNATIALSEFPFNILATTNIAGFFKVEGICVSQEEILVVRNGYTSQTGKATQINPTTSTMTIILTEIVFPQITVHPESKLRFKDQAVTLCCKAEATPSPQYEWLFNDRAADEYQHDGEDGSQLVIPQLTKNMSGEVKCRAYNDYGAEFSDVATIKVLDTGDSCDPTPSQRITTLPPGCVYGETNSTTVDVGKCRNEKCNGVNLNHTNTCTDNNYCCRAKTQQQIKVLCFSTTYIDITRITSCGCGKCIRARSTIRGVAQGGADNVPFRFGYIYLGDKYLTRTRRKGDFSFEVPPGVTRLVITFKDNGGYNDFYELTKVIPFTVGYETFVTVKMRPRPKPISVNASEGFEIPLGGDPTSGVQQLPPAAAISMPPQSLMTEDGEIYNGTAKVTVSFADPRNETQVREADGDFTAISEDGEQELLETYGVMKLDFQDSKGAKLEPSADIDVLFEPEEFNITREEAEAVKLWYMDEKTGRWRSMDSGLKQHESRRSKRSGRLFYFGKITRDKYLHIINLDVPAREKCYVKIETNSNGLEDAQDGKITVLVSQNNNHRYTEHSITANTEECIETFCTETFATIQVTLNGKYLMPRKRSLSVAVELQHGIKFNRSDKSSERFSNRITMTKLSRPNTSPSPFYNDMNSCVKDTTDNSFYFEAVQTIEPFKEILQISGRLVDEDYWYEGINSRLCFVKIAQVDHDWHRCPGNTAYFHVESFRADKTSAGYNIVSTSTSNPTACAEYKCPNEANNVLVKVTVTTSGHFLTTSRETKELISKRKASFDNNHAQFTAQYTGDAKIGLIQTILREEITDERKKSVKDECLGKSTTAAIRFHCCNEWCNN